MSDFGKATCGVCHGRGTIRLSFDHAPKRVFDGTIDAPTINIKEYACPECRAVSEDRIAITRAEPVQFLSDHEHGAEIRRCAVHEAAHRIVDVLLKRGDIVVTERPHKDPTLRELVATLGIVSANTVASLEQRVNARQFEVAHTLVLDAAKGIRVWNSHYTGDEGGISKAQAVRAVNEAYEALRKRMAAT